MSIVKKTYFHFQNLTLRVGVWASLLLPGASFADNGPSNPFSNFNIFKDGNKDPIKAAGGLFEEGLKYACIVVGAIVIIGAAGYIWHTVNMTHEEKEKHNVGLRLILGVIGVVASIGLIAFAFTTLNNG